MASLIVLVLRYIFLVLLYGFLLHILLILRQDLKQALHPARKPLIASKPPARDRNCREQAVLLVLGTGSPNLAPGTRLPLQDKNFLGRDSENNIQVDDPHVSGRHAMIYLDDDSYWLQDTGSTNGTMLNDFRIVKVSSLSQGDKIKIGKTTFLFSR